MPGLLVMSNVGRQNRSFARKAQRDGGASFLLLFAACVACVAGLETMVHAARSTASDCAVVGVAFAESGAIGRSVLLRSALAHAPQKPTPINNLAPWSSVTSLPLTVGFGTSGMFSAAAIALGLQLGYRMLDTAAFYRNEQAVGEAVRTEIETGRVKRSDVIVTTKVWWTELGYQRTSASLESSIERLGLEYLDLALVHWPGPWLSGSVRENEEKRRGTWSALEEAVSAGRVRKIGVSNYIERHLEEMLAYCTIPPAVNQIELHPYRQQQSLLQYCHQHGIQVEAYSPLASGSLGLLQDPMIVAIANAHGATPAQVVLQWHLQQGVVPIAKSTSRSRLVENLAAPARTGGLTAAELAAMSRLNRDLSCDITAGLFGGVGLTDPHRIA